MEIRRDRSRASSLIDLLRMLISRMRKNSFVIMCGDSLGFGVETLIVH